MEDEFILSILPKIEPLIKLVPTINPIGSSTDSSIIKLILPFFEPFCSPIINNMNKHKLKVIEKKIFLNDKYIFFDFNKILIQIINNAFFNTSFFC